jgi:hypothetical protein
LNAAQQFAPFQRMEYTFYNVVSIYCQDTSNVATWLKLSWGGLIFTASQKEKGLMHTRLGHGNDNLLNYSNNWLLHVWKRRQKRL